MMDMSTKLATLWPEIMLTLVAFVVMVVGLSPQLWMRRATYGIAAFGLVIAAILAATGSPAATGDLAVYMKVAICLIGLALLVAAAEVPDESQTLVMGDQAFDPASTSRGEFFGFLLLSLVGAMLCAGADDLVWLFLALELTSLPTYVMVATSRKSIKAPEAAVKYFFLGAMAAAIFLYGFALLYGATGTTYISQMHAIFADPNQGISHLALAGLVLAIVGVCFKIAAVPMHFYAADVYQGAATPVTTFLAFVPKTAGFVTLIVLLNAATGWSIVDNTPAIATLLWILAVLTMFVGNTLALLQDNVKRVLAYSSIAHTGYMLVGLLAGAGPAASGGFLLRNGLAAILFYLIAYGVMNLGAFSVLGLLKRAGEEAETFDDLRGLAARRPALAAVMAICVLSLTGVPPLVGFWGKLYLFGSAISAGYVGLAILAMLNSAIAAFYYLRIVAVTYMSEPNDDVVVSPLPSRSGAAMVSAAAVIVMSLAAGPLVDASLHAAAGFQTQPHMPAAPRPVHSEPADHDSLEVSGVNGEALPAASASEASDAI
ncbi:NADH-quinone oxidoreductase subunit N [Planctomycetales bacterium ZRK34]|nr:NADH-quinone oxidoreductase subunit N [Planctomycetales bacterium ZRK34]